MVQKARRHNLVGCRSGDDRRPIHFGSRVSGKTQPHWLTWLGATCIAASALSFPSSAPAQQEGPLSSATTAGPIPDYHTVQSGDTLYDLSGRYYGDVYEWPRLWSYNAQVTNPHWIYPGDIIYLKPPGPTDGAQSTPGQALRQPVPIGPTGPMVLHLAVGGFISETTLPYVGRITGSPKAGRLLGEWDSVFVGFGEQSYSDEERSAFSDTEIVDVNDPEVVPKENDLFAIIRPMGKVEDEEGNTIGIEYFVLGSLRLTEVSPLVEGEKQFWDSAMITQSWMEIERGDLLVPYETQLRVVNPQESSKNLAGSIVGTIYPHTLIGEFHYVYINRGVADGVEIGNRFFVYQREEGLQRPTAEPPDALPWRRVGQVLVIEPKERFSTALVIDSKRELLVGDRVEMYEGY